jgi:hypothetical protein
MVALPIPSSEPAGPIVGVLFVAAAAAGFVVLLVQAIRYFRDKGDDD